MRIRERDWGGETGGRDVHDEKRKKIKERVGEMVQDGV